MRWRSPDCNAFSYIFILEMENVSVSVTKQEVVILSINIILHYMIFILLSITFETVSWIFRRNFLLMQLDTSFFLKADPYNILDIRFLSHTGAWARSVSLTNSIEEPLSLGKVGFGRNRSQRGSVAASLLFGGVKVSLCKKWFYHRCLLALFIVISKAKCSRNSWRCIDKCWNPTFLSTTYVGDSGLRDCWLLTEDALLLFHKNYPQIELRHEHAHICSAAQTASVRGLSAPGTCSSVPSKSKWNKMAPASSELHKDIIPSIHSLFLIIVLSEWFA